MKNLFLALGLIFAASRLLAVTPEPLTEVVSFSSKLTTVGAGGGSGTLTVYGEGTSSSGSAGANGPESGLGAVSLRPGKQYTATYAGIVNNVSSGSYWLNFTAPGGYDLYLNGVRADLWPGTIPGTTTFFSYSYSYTLELRPADCSPVAAGNFSGIDLGKSVNWEVGLGGLRNGRSAGRIFSGSSISRPARPRATASITRRQPTSARSRLSKTVPRPSACARSACRKPSWIWWTRRAADIGSNFIRPRRPPGMVCSTLSPARIRGGRFGWRPRARAS